MLRNIRTISISNLASALCSLLCSLLSQDALILYTTYATCTTSPTTTPAPSSPTPPNTESLDLILSPTPPPQPTKRQVWTAVRCYETLKTLQKGLYSSVPVCIIYTYIYYLYTLYIYIYICSLYYIIYRVYIYNIMCLLHRHSFWWIFRFRFERRNCENYILQSHI